MPSSPLPRRRRAAIPYAPLAYTAAMLLALAYGSASAASVAAIDTGGSGTLTKCRNWLVMQTCHKDYRVIVPDHIGLGDELDLIFGSNQKEYFFPVARIVLEGDRCIIYSEKNAGRHDAERLVISPCRPGEGSPPGAPAPAAK
jgi:hypothetical protein